MAKKNDDKEVEKAPEITEEKAKTMEFLPPVAEKEEKVLGDIDILIAECTELRKRIVILEDGQKPGEYSRENLKAIAVKQLDELPEITTVKKLIKEALPKTGIAIDIVLFGAKEENHNRIKRNIETWCNGNSLSYDQRNSEIKISWR